ncbi:MAG: hypothetical protein LBV30_08860 [Propionibacteriaceae bacterium]|nr:hypothetical protein [Propionibacteriaceae bacterium]
MPTLTVRNLDEQVYSSLQALATASHQSMEATARDIMRSGVQRRQRWLHATLADLSGPSEIIDLDTPFVRSADGPRHVDFS